MGQILLVGLSLRECGRRREVSPWVGGAWEVAAWEVSPWDSLVCMFAPALGGGHVIFRREEHTDKGEKARKDRAHKGSLQERPYCHLCK
jgi:hypothetical protein